MNAPNRILLAVMISVSVMIGAAGCGSRPDRLEHVNTVASMNDSSEVEALPTWPWREGMKRERFLAGYSIEYRPIECIILSDHQTDSDVSTKHRTIFLIGGIHGDEPAGIPLLHSLADVLASGRARYADRTIVIVPNLNPDGVAMNHRANARGVDLNRNFESLNWSRRLQDRNGPTPLSEPETQVLVDLVNMFEPDCIVSVHQPIQCIDYDGPDDARLIAQAMSRAIGGALPIRKLGARPGSLGSWAGNDLKIPTLTVELPRRAHVLADDVLWDRYGAMLLAAICWELASHPAQSEIAQPSYEQDHGGFHSASRGQTPNQ